MAIQLFSGRSYFQFVLVAAFSCWPQTAKEGKSIPTKASLLPKTKAVGVSGEPFSRGWDWTQSKKSLTVFR